MNGAQPLKRTFRTVSGEATVPVQSKAERILSRCEDHFEKNRDGWVAKRFNALLIKNGAQPMLRPAWAIDDRKAHLYRTATFLVQHKQQMRVRKIKEISRRMIGQDRGDIGRG